MTLDRENKLLIGLCAMAAILIAKLFISFFDLVCDIRNAHRHGGAVKERVCTDVPKESVEHERGSLVVRNYTTAKGFERKNRAGSFAQHSTCLFTDGNDRVRFTLYCDNRRCAKYYSLLFQVDHGF